MTGREAGFCAGFVTPGYSNQMAGCGAGFGRGRGYRRMYFLTGMPGWVRGGYMANGGYETSADEKELLKSQAQFLENQLQQINKRLDSFIKEDE
jgi:hypothetical protein